MTFLCYQFIGNNQRVVNRFYKGHKQNVSCNSKDKVFVAATSPETTNTANVTQLETTNGIIAALIIRPTETPSSSGALLLRSLFVAPEFRHSGIGSKLTKLATRTITNDIYCLCEPELIPFYKSLGFSLQASQATKTSALIANTTIDTQIKKGLCLMHSPFQR